MKFWRQPFVLIIDNKNELILFRLRSVCSARNSKKAFFYAFTHYIRKNHKSKKTHRTWTHTYISVIHCSFCRQSFLIKSLFCTHKNFSTLGCFSGGLDVFFWGGPIRMSTQCQDIPADWLHKSCVYSGPSHNHNDFQLRIKIYTINNNWKNL